MNMRGSRFGVQCEKRSGVMTRLRCGWFSCILCLLYNKFDSTVMLEYLVTIRNDDKRIENAIEPERDRSRDLMLSISEHR